MALASELVIHPNSRREDISWHRRDISTAGRSHPMADQDSWDWQVHIDSLTLDFKRGRSMADHLVTI